jgi:uncharacterized protein YuzE
MRVVYDPQADAAMVHVLDGVPVDHWDVAEDGLVLGLTSDGRLAQCELWSVRSAGFEDYNALPVEARHELRRLTQPNIETHTQADTRQG